MIRDPKLYQWKICINISGVVAAYASSQEEAERISAMKNARSFAMGIKTRYHACRPSLKEPNND